MKAYSCLDDVYVAINVVTKTVSLLRITYGVVSNPCGMLYVLPELIKTATSEVIKVKDRNIEPVPLYT